MREKLHRLRMALAAVLMAGSVAFPATSLAENAVASTEPLVTVRFNQPHVYFDQQLYSAISKAVAVKPDVVFDVVSYAPATGNEDVDAKWQAVAGRNTKSVIAAMADMGVPAGRITISGKSQPNLRYDETQIFVR